MDPENKIESALLKRSKDEKHTSMQEKKREGGIGG